MVWYFNFTQYSPKKKSLFSNLWQPFNDSALCTNVTEYWL